ncbi:MAG: hypothetical protein Q4P72_05740 [Eubacteriales bacterium]|nr:hypothetical protein [Eubacteriales bacterium]
MHLNYWEYSKVFRDKKSKLFYLILILASCLQIIISVQPHDMVMEKEKTSVFKLLSSFRGELTETRRHDFEIYAERFISAREQINNTSKALKEGTISPEDYQEQVLAARSILKEEQAYNTLLKDVLYLSSYTEPRPALLYTNGWHFLFDSQRLLFPFLLLLLSLAIRFVSIEEAGKMLIIMRSSQCGVANVYRAKQLLLFFVVLIGSCFFGLFRLLIAQFCFGLELAGAPACSLSRYAGLPRSISLLGLFFISQVLFFVAAYAFVLLIAYVQRIGRSAAASSVFAASLVLLSVVLRARSQLLDGLISVNLMTMKYFERSSAGEQPLLYIAIASGCQIVLILLLYHLLRDDYKSRITRRHPRSRKFRLGLLLPLLLFALTGCTSSRTLGHVDFAGSGFSYNGSFIGGFNSEDMRKIQEIRVDQHGDLKITELNLDPQVYTPFTRISGFISHQGNHFYYQLEHLRYEYAGVSHVRQLSVYAYEIRSYDLDTGEDRRIIYRNNADFDIITKPFYVDGDRVFRVQWNSIYEEGIAGSRLFLNLEEFKQILTIYDGKIWGVDHGDTLRSYDLTQGEERTYPSCIPGSHFSVSDDGKMYFVNSWKSALCEYDLKQDQLRYIYEIPEAHCYLIGQFASHIYYAYMDPTILRDRVAQVDVSGKRLADLEVELVPTDRTIPIEGGILVASASGDLKYIPNS